MTDKEALFQYRISQADETITDAERMLEGHISPRTITNRAYYAMFYALLALFLKSGINPRTSKHSAVISLFDREFVLSGKIAKRYSVLLHKIFNARLKADYTEYVNISPEETAQYVSEAKAFVEELKRFCEG